MTTTHLFTFGQSHMSSYPQPKSGRLADFWVAVELPDGHKMTHREVFVENFTAHYCPRRYQFAMEYETDRLKPEYFPGGELCRITDKGIQDNRQVG